MLKILPGVSRERAQTHCLILLIASHPRVRIVHIWQVFIVTHFWAPILVKLFLSALESYLQCLDQGCFKMKIPKYVSCIDAFALEVRFRYSIFVLIAMLIGVAWSLIVQWKNWKESPYSVKLESNPWCLMRTQNFRSIILQGTPWD